MTLFDLASLNNSLLYIDDLNDSAFKISELASIPFNDNNKKLAFAYLDNSIESIAVFER